MTRPRITDLLRRWLNRSAEPERAGRPEIVFRPGDVRDTAAAMIPTDPED